MIEVRTANRWHHRTNASAWSRALSLCGVLLLTPLLTKSLQAQKRGSRVRVLTGSALRTSPGGNVLGTLSRSFDADVEMEQGTSVRVRLNGFVVAADLDLRPGQARATVSGDGTEVRIGSSGKEPVLAMLRKGTVVFPAQKAAGFYSVGKPVWIDKSRLAKFSTARPAAPPAETLMQKPSPQAKPTPKPQPVAPAATPSRPLQTASPTSLFTSPGNNPLLGLKVGTVVTPLAAENGWTRVRIEGWVPSKDLVDANSAVAEELSAADLRADADAAKGRVVHWEVEALSYQLADGLRRELAGAPYILALGPGKERAILYLAVPDSLVPAARGLAPMSIISVTAKVRTGRSQPGGVPILDLLELSRH